MIRGLIILFAVIAAFLETTEVVAEPQVRVSLRPQQISLEETATLTIRIEWSKAEASYAFVLPRLNFQNLTLERQGESQESSSRGSDEITLKTFEIEIKPVEPGIGIIRAFTLKYIDPTTQTGGSFTVSEQKVIITKPAINISRKLAMSLLIFLALVVLTVFVVGHRNKTKKDTQKSDTTLLTHPELEKMRELVSNPSKKEQKEILYEWSNQLRHFVLDFYQVKLGQVTEREILETLKSREIPRDEIEKLGKLFNRLHEAKFTGMAVPESDFRLLQRDLLSYIEGKRTVGHP